MPRNSRFKISDRFKPLVIALGLTFSVTTFAETLKQAQQSFDNGAYSTAVIELKNLLQDEPKNAAARLLLGRTYLKQQDLLTAIKELEKSRQLGAPAAGWLVPLSRAYLLSGEADKAIEALLRPL